MSLLVCPLSELNRRPISDTFAEVIRVLGKKASGVNDFLPSLVCDACGDKRKSFSYNLAISSCGHEFRYTIDVAEDGKYFINDLGQLDHPEYNHLLLIGMVKERLDSLVVSDSQGLRSFNGHEAKCGYNSIACICGGKNFTRHE